MSDSGPPSRDALWLLIVLAVVGFLVWSLWPSAAERAHWREITADMREPK